MGSNPGYTTVNVYPDDRDQAKKAKEDGETWSEFLRRAAETLESDTDD